MKQSCLWIPLVLLSYYPASDAFILGHRRLPSSRCLPNTCTATPTQISSRRKLSLSHHHRLRPRYRKRLAFSSLSASSSSFDNNNQYQSKNLHPISQLLITICFYIFHLFVLAQHQVVFPFQLIPNEKGHFVGIGWDSIAGMLTLIAYGVARRLRKRTSGQKSIHNDGEENISSPTAACMPLLFSRPNSNEAPWKLPSPSRRLAITSLLCLAALVQAYFWTGRLSIFWEDIVYNLSGLGFYITAPMLRSLCVLLGHLSWVAIGSALLKWLPRPPKFFPGRRQQKTTDSESSTTQVESPVLRWYQSNIAKSNWLWWVIGGYYVSSWLFNIADGLNQYALPPQVLQDAQESIVSQLVNPEHNDVRASVVGYIAPCISAPWWEEVLYRGFCLPVAAQCLGYPAAVVIQGIIFSAHHMSLTAALPLAVLGWTWAILYTKSRNLWTVILVHALWNSRVFIGSWLGL